MIDTLIAYSVRNKFVIGLLVTALIGWGIYAMSRLPVDAVPDITNNQVQVITISPDLATQEVEQFITAPVELAMQNLPGVEEIRSVSRFGLSVVTVVFRESMGTYLPRQLVAEKITEAGEAIPAGMGTPEMAPITTGLGEIYQYTLRAASGYEDQYTAMELRTIQDWIVKRQLSGVPGVIEVNTVGGFLKQYEIALNPEALRSANITIGEVLEALERSNENTGGSYIEKNPNTYFIRSEGMVQELADIEQIVLKTVDNIPILIRDIAEVRFGHAPRYGAMTINGRGNTVGGVVLMLKGANAAEVTERIKERVVQIQQSLPEGVLIEPYLVRDSLVQRAMQTVEKNLIEGGLIVIFILVLLLGNWRAGLVVASVIPLALLFALGMMQVFAISANLMSLGAIDFGLIVDGAVIIVESVVHRLQVGFAGRQLSQQQMDDEITEGAIRIRKSAAFGEIIILMVYIPILALTGIEGKMFRPMALTVGFAILGALVLSLTYVPMMSALLLRKKIERRRTFADRIMDLFQRLYRPVIHTALRFKTAVVLLTVVLFACSLWQFSRLGGEFIPTLDEGDLAIQQILAPGSSLDQSVAVSNMVANKLKTNFPEVVDVVARIGAAEIPTDPMPIEIGDLVVTMKPREEWVSASDRVEMFERFEAVLSEIPGVNYEFTQPIQLRFNELLTGSRADIAVKIYGEDLDILFRKAKEAEALFRNIDGIASVKTEQIVGMPQIVIRFKYPKLAQYGLQVRDVNRVIRTAFAGEKVGDVYEGERRFDMVVRLQENYRRDIDNVEELYIPLPNGRQVPLAEVAEVTFEEAPMQISRENTRRRIVVGVNAGSKDTETLVEEMQALLTAQLELPPGYFITYGGQFENLVQARNRLSIAVPVALALIFILLYFTFHSVAQAALIFTAIPLSAIGGIWALWLRGMPFSISAGIGFIALFGVAVLNGIVLIAYFNQLREEGVSDTRTRILEGTRVRLRPVLMTASVASLGFLPMALSTSGGAEVQRPLATVVIGGLISATFLTLVILPILYSWLSDWKQKRSGKIGLLLLPGLIALPGITNAQRSLSLEEALEMARSTYPGLQLSQRVIQQQEALEGSGFDPAKTQFYYGGDGLGQGDRFSEHSLGVRQSFAWPGVYRDRNALQESRTGLARAAQQMSERELEALVAGIYADWVAQQRKLTFLNSFDSLYVAFLEIAQLRERTGAATPLERITAENKRQQIGLSRRQCETARENLEQQLQLLLNTTEDLVPPSDLPARFTPDPAVPEHPLFAYYRQQEQVARDQLQLVEDGLLPNLNLGYAYQQFGNINGLHSIQLGISIPIYRGAQRKKIQAAEVEVQIAASRQATEAIQLEQRKLQQNRELRQAAQALDYYDRQGHQIAEDLIRTAGLQYENGVLTYVAYVQALEQAYHLRLDYLDELQRYNRMVVGLNYLW
ncbi:CusA/CzcA family heavy metal efflux RND transporter [Flavilitoribacter nigricans]|uniref:CusA/CzcA family heavy metal efflux RND transporter n=1 Tax=Flavilitoribacter nigricans (strain ATCC 23147 / DSM 23189 / NBRC 102662 / NCIMB 1420 / SS-2) TaxID=1122177 RepID=A0A2D0NC55_FLAN2|nr:CusA/CzcA family heavy metal efflux RND transporter [Flavilitoribacter nigricans]PHN06091.1 CusA/CzcA family heavy metal efflux RND transporter [Flavilitoribacter nigricans DSM 23189 = NBRC 102662]